MASNKYLIELEHNLVEVEAEWCVSTNGTYEFGTGPTDVVFKPRPLIAAFPRDRVLSITTLDEEAQAHLEAQAATEKARAARVEELLAQKKAADEAEYWKARAAAAT